MGQGACGAAAGAAGAVTGGGLNYLTQGEYFYTRVFVGAAAAGATGTGLRGGNAQQIAVSGLIQGSMATLIAYIQYNGGSADQAQAAAQGPKNRSSLNPTPNKYVHLASHDLSPSGCITPQGCFGAGYYWHYTVNTRSPFASTIPYDPYIHDVNVFCDCAFRAELSISETPTGNANFDIPGVRRVDVGLGHGNSNYYVHIYGDSHTATLIVLFRYAGPHPTQPLPPITGN